MIFKFIRYTQPGWQFNLEAETNKYFATCILSENKVEKKFLDQRFQTKSAMLADAGYRLWNMGNLLQSNNSKIKKIYKLPAPTLIDEYIFIRKYWGRAWTAFALLLRIITLKNFLKEINAFYKTRKILRENLYAHPVKYNYHNFQSKLLVSSPLVAVIIPTLNRYKYLREALQDLEKQSYKNFEVIIFDQSDNFNEMFYKSFNLKFKIYHQKEKLLWTARNNAIKSTTAEFLLFFDDDSRVEKNWIEEHLKCIDFFGADISAGVSLAVAGGKIPDSYNYFRWADQFDSGNAMVKRNVFKKAGLFDEQFNGMRMGDGEFGIRVYLNGFKSISNPVAARVHLKVKDGGLREIGSWDSFRPKKWFAPKPIPSVVYLYKKYFPKELYRNTFLIGIILSNVSYKHKRNNKMLAISILLSMIKSPVLLIQYFKATRIAKKMLLNNYSPETLPG